MFGLSIFVNSLRISRPSRGLFLVLLGVLAPLLIAACGGDDPTAVPQPAATNTRQPPPAATAVPDPTVVAPDPTPTAMAPAMELENAAIEVISQGPLGPHLVDAKGMTLYLFANDERNISNCSGGCAEAWPPLLTIGSTTAGDDLDSERLSTFEREDGSQHVTYNGKPLYYFANDADAGDTLGQDRGDVWFLVSPDGSPIKTAATVIATESATLGTILTDSNGNSVYQYTRDEREVSNCAGGCALAWPPVLTVEDPVAGEGVSEDRIGSISRGNGAKQVTYNGWPLYYFASDEKPGDSTGQDRGGVWFVLTTDGGAVYTNAPVNATENAEQGVILTDAAGRSLYLYTGDEPNVSNCAGGCALAWPPLITVGDPAAGEGVSATRIGTTTREDGSKQVTFDGSPLYYYAADEKPGDAMGQNRGEVWFVISNSEPTSIALGEQNDSGQTGTAVLTGRGSFTNVSLNLSSGSSETELVHIHEGQCAPADLGGVAHELTSFEGGSGASVTNIEVSLSSLLTGAFAVNTHTAGDPGVYTSCGNLAAESDSLTISLDEMNDSGQSGFVTLSSRGDQTEVVVSATGGISALAHIHEGSCAELGGVAHDLNDTSEAISSTTVSATLDSLINGSFAINLHTDGNAGVYSSCGDISKPLAVASISPSGDDTLYQSLGNQSNNGAGEWLFAGTTRAGDLRRSVIAFDIEAAIPAGSTVSSVSLTLTVSRSIASASEIGIHPLLGAWQEGAADAEGNEGAGAGAAATDGDVTWTHRVFSSEAWDAPGGDFSPDASASAAVNGRGAYTWGSTSQMVADVQAWLDDSSGNFGWLIKGDESRIQTTSRFDSSESPETDGRPVLVVEYRPS